MTTVSQKILSNLFYVILYVTCVYLMVILGDWFTIYYKDPSNPVLLFAYISMIHLISLPLLWFSLKGRSSCFWPFIFVNACWLIMVMIGVALVYSRELGKWTLIQWQGNPLHHIVLISSFCVCCAAEVLAVIQLAHIQKSVSPD